MNEKKVDIALMQSKKKFSKNYISNDFFFFFFFFCIYCIFRLPGENVKKKSNSNKR